MWVLWLVGSALLVAAIFVLGAMYGKKLEQKAALEASKLRSRIAGEEKRF